MPNDPVLVYYLLVPCMSQYIRLSCIFIHWVAYISPRSFCNPKQSFCNFSFYVNISRSFQFRVCFSLFSLLFLSFSRLPNTPLEDDNSRDAWLSLLALRRKVASLVLGQLQVVLIFKMLQVLCLWFHIFQTRVYSHLMSLLWSILTML